MTHDGTESTYMNQSEWTRQAVTSVTGIAGIVLFLIAVGVYDNLPGSAIVVSDWGVPLPSLLTPAAYVGAIWLLLVPGYVAFLAGQWICAPSATVVCRTVWPWAGLSILALGILSLVQGVGFLWTSALMSVVVLACLIT